MIFYGNGVIERHMKAAHPVEWEYSLNEGNNPDEAGRRGIDCNLLNFDSHWWRRGEDKDLPVKMGKSASVGSDKLEAWGIFFKPCTTVDRSWILLCLFRRTFFVIFVCLNLSLRKPKLSCQRAGLIYHSESRNISKRPVNYRYVGALHFVGNRTTFLIYSGKRFRYSKSLQNFTHLHNSLKSCFNNICMRKDRWWVEKQISMQLVKLYGGSGERERRGGVSLVWLKQGTPELLLQSHLSCLIEFF